MSNDNWVLIPQIGIHRIAGAEMNGLYLPLHILCRCEEKL